MSQTIKNIKDLSKVLRSKIISILELVADDVKAEIDDALDRYYNEYDPSDRASRTSFYYHRTNQLKDCCKISQPKIRGNTVIIEVYLDIDSLNYETEGANPYKTIRAGDAGLHGGWDISHFSSGQVSWQAIKNNDGSRWGSGTQIWKEPMDELFGNGKLIESFKRHAKERGLNIK